MPRRPGFLLVWLAFLAPAASAQTFVDASHLLPVAPGGGAVAAITVADFNGDGRADIYYPDRLLRQRADGTFENVLGTSGISVQGQAPLLAMPSDPNADGLLDILFLDAAPGSRYYENVNTERYQLANSERSLNVRTLSTGAAWGDFDVDGQVDLFVGSADGQNQLYVGSASGMFTNVSATKRTASSGGACGMAVADFDLDLDLDVYIPTCKGNPTNRMLVYNSLSDRFNDASGQLNVQSLRYSESAAWLDYDNDGWMDLFVTNARFDVEDPQNNLFRNLNGTRFVDMAGIAGVEGNNAERRRAVAAADFNNDGWTDLYLTVEDARHHLYLNRGDGTFADAPTPDHPASTIMTAADVNGDGWVDLLYAVDGGIALFTNSGAGNWTKIALRQPGSNRLGLGARVRVTAGDLVQTGQMIPGGGNLSHGQEPELHFGLGDAETIDEVRINWQDGTVETFVDLPANQLLTLAKGGVRNEPPDTFSAVSPPDASAFSNEEGTIEFSWEPAADSDPVTYTFSIRGLGAKLRFPDLNATSVSVPTSSLAKDQIYTWSVFAWDGLSARPVTESRVLTLGDPARANATLAAPSLFEFGIPEMATGDAVFFDVDGDLDLDLLAIGNVGGLPLGGMYRATDQGVLQTSGGEFIFKGLANTGTSIDPVTQPRMGVGDLDADGDPDVIVTGLHRDSGNPHLSVYFNFEGSLTAGMIDVVARWGGPVEFRDVDGDGDADVLVSGSTSAVPPYQSATVLYRNNNLAYEEWATFPGAMFGDADFADADGDGDLDLVLLGDAGTGQPKGSVYRNDGDTFTEVPLPGSNLVYASAAWADYDADGLADLVIAGAEFTPGIMTGRTRLYRQISPWVFEQQPIPLTNIMGGTVLWGDYENDGDPDLILSGATGVLGEIVGRVYRNQGGRFVAELDFQGALGGRLAAGDYNLDGDLDFIVMGLGPDGEPSLQFFINQQVAEPVPVTR